MALADSLRTPQRRINPHRGLVIDVPRWIEAHEYHRVQQARHGLLMHCPGIIWGLEVVECQPPASSVVVSPGAALDPKGRLIVVAEPLRLDLPLNSGGLAYIALQYREVPDSATRRSGEDQDHPLYTLEVYSISGGKELPSDPYLELARIQVSGTESEISNPYDWRTPSVDEIDLRFREKSGPWPALSINIGVVSADTSIGATPLHVSGTVELVQNINYTTMFRARFWGLFDLSTGIEGCDLLVMAGRKAFSLTPTSRETLAAYLEAEGILLGESCKVADSEAQEADAFQRSFEALAEEMETELFPVDRGHPLLSACHVFSGVSTGVWVAPLVKVGASMIYSEGDYGCLWSGGHPKSPALRETIRSAFDFGVNLGAYSARSTYRYSLKAYTS